MAFNYHTKRQEQAYASAARTASPADYVAQVPNGATGVQVIVNTTASATPSTVVNVRGRFTNVGTDVLLLASAAIAANGQVLLQIAPGLTPAANLSAAAMLPKILVIDPVHGNANSHTYNIELVWQY